MKGIQKKKTGREIEKIMKSENPGFRTAAFFLYVFSLVYGFVLFCRRFLYKRGILESERLPAVIISVGNITAGGSGKTPLAIYLAGLISGHGFKTAIVSRGYKGRFEKKGGIVSDGEKIVATPSEAGDEPYMMAVKTGVPVICGSNRYRAGLEAVRLGVGVIILDDGFQHLKLERDINLLLLDMKNPFGNGFVIPRGLMREPVSAINDADAFVMTRCNDLSIRRPGFANARMPVFYSVHRQYKAKDADEKYTGSRVLAVSGIADNEAFIKGLGNRGYNVAGHIFFDDHHSYNMADIDMIMGVKAAKSADLIVTTEKDYVKLSEMIMDNSFWVVLGVEHDFGKGKNDFDNWILEKIKEVNASVAENYRKE